MQPMCTIHQWHISDVLWRREHRYQNLSVIITDHNQGLSGMITEQCEPSFTIPNYSEGASSAPTSNKENKIY